MEKYLFISFRSRENSIKFHELMKSHRIESIVFNTPKEAEIGCGLSIKFSPRQINTVKTLLERYKMTSFIGIFEVTVSGNRRYIRPI